MGGGWFSQKVLSSARKIKPSSNIILNGVKTMYRLRRTGEGGCRGRCIVVIYIQKSQSAIGPTLLEW